MKLFCITKSIELKFDKKIELNLAQLTFWLERFVPNIEFNKTAECGSILFIEQDKKQECIVNDEKVIKKYNIEDFFTKKHK